MSDAVVVLDLSSRQDGTVRVGWTSGAVELSNEVELATAQGGGLMQEPARQLRFVNAFQGSAMSPTPTYASLAATRIRYVEVSGTPPAAEWLISARIEGQGVTLARVGASGWETTSDGAYRWNFELALP